MNPIAVELAEVSLWLNTIYQGAYVPWFWSIEKADLFPDRQPFFFEMSLLFEGTIGAVSTSATGQMSLIDSTGSASYDKDGKLSYIVNGTQIALDFQASQII